MSFAGRGVLLPTPGGIGGCVSPGSEGAGKKFRLSAKYFSDDEVKLVTAVGMLQTQGPNQKRNVL